MKLIIDCCLGITGYELPPLKINVRQQVFLPGMSHSRLEREHQHAPPSHAPRQLIRSKGLAEAHLAVPEEMRHALAFTPVTVEIGCRLVYSRLLLRAHTESLVASPCRVFALSHCHYCSLDLLGSAAKPLALHVPAAHLRQLAMNLMVHKRGPILPHGTLLHQYAVWRFARPDDVILLAHTLLHTNCGIAHLQQSFQLWVILIFISINHRNRLRLRREIIVCCHNFVVCCYGAHAFCGRRNLDNLVFLALLVLLAIYSCSL